MRRKFGRKLQSSSGFSEEPPSPTEGLINLADVMLVFSVGLMISIVMHWNINILEVENIANSEQEVEQSQYAEVEAQVYRDEVTGKLYIVEPGEQPGGASGG